VAAVRVAVGESGYAEAGILELRPLDPEIWKTVSLEPPEAGVSVSGRLLGPSGDPAPGLRVLVFRDPGMGERPLARSLPTRANGEFVLPLPGPGVYFLVARSGFSGPIQPGELVGTYAGPDGTGLRVGDGARLGGLTIQVSEAK